VVELPSICILEKRVDLARFSLEKIDGLYILQIICIVARKKWLKT